MHAHKLSSISVAALCLASAYAGGVSQSGSTCTVTANGNQTDDTPNILQAFQQCNDGGTVVFPECESYWIATRLNPVINNIVVEWHGQWTVSILRELLE